MRCHAWTCFVRWVHEWHLLWWSGVSCCTFSITLQTGRLSCLSTVWKMLLSLTFMLSGPLTVPTLYSDLRNVNEILRVKVKPHHFAQLCSVRWVAGQDPAVDASLWEIQEVILGGFIILVWLRLLPAVSWDVCAGSFVKLGITCMIHEQGSRVVTLEIQYQFAQVHAANQGLWRYIFLNCWNHWNGFLVAPQQLMHMQFLFRHRNNKWAVIPKNV